MNRRLLCALLTVLMVFSCFNVVAFASDTDSAALGGEAVVYVNGESSAQGDGDGSIDNPYKDFNVAVAALATSGGTVVVSGKTDCTTTSAKNAVFENTGDILVTSSYGGIDYRKAFSAAGTDGAYLNVGSAPVAQVVDNPGKITFDAIDIITTNWANWHFCGHGFELTESVRHYYWWTDTANDANSRYYGATVQLMMMGSGKAVPDSFGVLPEVIVSENHSAPRVYLGPRENVTIGGARITVNTTIAQLVIGNNVGSVAYPNHGALTVNGDITVTVNGTVNAVLGTAYPTGESGLAAFNGDLTFIVNPTGTVKGEVPSGVKPTKGNFKMVNISAGAVATYDGNGDIAVTLDADVIANFVIFKNETSGNSYAFKAVGGKATAVLPEGGTYSTSYVTADAVEVLFVDSLYENEVEKAVTTSEVAVLMPRLASTETHIFRGWTDVEDGEMKYEAGKFYSFDESTTLYAVWSDAPKYTVSFLADGEAVAEFVNIEGARIEYPTEPSKEGYYFQRWDKTPEFIGSEDIEINAVFVPREDYGNVVYLDGAFEGVGDGTIGSPYKTLASASAGILDEGGTIVVKGVTTIEYSNEINNNGDILITSLDPVTGVDYTVTESGGVLGEGAYLRNYKGAFLGNGVGKITFDNIALFSTKSWNFFNMCAGETVIGANTKMYLDSGGVLYKGAYFGFGSEHVADKTDINIKATIAAPASYYTAYLTRTGVTGTVINSVDITLDTYVKFNLSNNSDSVSPTVNGPVMFTVNKGGTTSRISDGGNMLAFGAKAYLSVITNDAEVTVTEPITALTDRTYRIASPAFGKVTHTENKGVYNVNSDTYSFAQLLDKGGAVVSETVIYGETNTLTAPEYGEYTVAYSNREFYSLDYASQIEALSDKLPESYAALTTDTEALTLTLPTPSEKIGYAFVGWAETEDGGAKYSAGDEYTLSADSTLYAVWKEILVYTVTFVDGNGTVLYRSEGYAGDAITFPSADVLPWDYEKKLLGFCFIDDEDRRVLSAIDVIPEANKTAIPVWGEIPKNETRLYVNGVNGDDSNSGKTPDNALLTIAKAVSLIKDSGGVIVCTDGKLTLTGAWNNSGDILLTSLDPLTGIDYRATELSQDGLSWKSGAHLWHGAVQFGSSEIRGRITLENLVLGTHANYQFLNFDGHPFTLGLGLSAYNKASDDARIAKTQTFYMRALGEAGASRTNEDGINFTLNTLENGATLYAVGKANNVIPSLNITVDTEFGGTIQYGNNSGGGTTTLRGPGRFTFNAGLKNSIKFPGDTNPVEGNIYAIYNNNATAALTHIVQAEGYGIISIHNGKDSKITHGETEGTFIATLCDGYSHRFIKLLGEDGNAVQYSEFVDGVARLEVTKIGEYTAEYTDISCHKVSYITGASDITVDDAYFEDGKVAELKSGLYRYGYIFEGWTDGENEYRDGIITMPENDVVLTAIWSEAPRYTVSFDAGGTEAVMPEELCDYVGERIALPRVYCSGKTFLGWSEDRDATIGVMHHVIDGDTTLYALFADGTAYTMESYFRTDDRWQFQRYMVDVYLENGAASEGVVKLAFDSSFLYSLGSVPEPGIDSSLSRSGRNLTLTWSGDVDATKGRVKLARIMLFFSVYGLGYEEIESRTSDEICMPVLGSTVDERTAYLAANIHKGIVESEVEVVGRLTVEGRESGVLPRYDMATVSVLDSFGDTVKRIVLESGDTAARSFEYTVRLAPGEYTLVAEKDTYKTRRVDITVEDGGELCELVLLPGDTLDENGEGDGEVNIDDFQRVLKGFANEFPTEDYLYAIDLNEDGVINVSDLAAVKRGLESEVGEIQDTSVDTSMKALDWSISVDDGKITVVGGSERALGNALDFISSEYPNGGAMPKGITHSEDYAVSDIIIGDASIREYGILAVGGEELALTYAGYIADEILRKTGYALPVVTEASGGKYIRVGENLLSDVHRFAAYERDGELYLDYGDEQSANMGADELLSRVLGLDSGEARYTVKDGDLYEGAWEVLTRFAVFSDTHVGKGKVPENPDWENYEGWLKPVYEHINSIHENPETRLDFVLSLGDNIDYGYDRNSDETDALRDYDYADYLRTIKWLTICDPVNPIEGRAEGTIPHYELKGNHDPSGVIRFLDKGYWTVENENGSRTAFIGFFTDYGGYPNINGDTSTYFSHGILKPETVEYVEEMILRAVEEGAKQIVLSSHFGIAQDLGAPILPETGLGRIGDLCDRYGVKLFFNGHEHDQNYTVRRYNDVYDIDCSMTRSKYAVVEISSTRAKVTVYNRSDNSLYKEEILPLN